MGHAVFMILFGKKDIPIRLIVAPMLCRNKTDRKKRHRINGLYINELIE